MRVQMPLFGCYNYFTQKTFPVHNIQSVFFVEKFSVTFSSHYLTLGKIRWTEFSLSAVRYADQHNTCVHTLIPVIRFQPTVPVFER